MKAVNFGLDGKVVLVTAASRGIGAAIAQCCRASGAKVAVNARKESSLHAAATDAVHSFPADLEDASAVTRLVPAVVERFGRLDGLVVNTAGPPLSTALDARMEQWQEAYDRLLRPAILLATAGAKAMLATGDGGSIVFITSTWAKQPALGGALSSVMRAGVSALAKQLANELAEGRIRVNSVMPGATATDRMSAILEAKAASNGTSIEMESAKALESIPMRTWGHPQDIANTVTFLLSPYSSFTTGVAMPVDGGAIRSIF